MPILSAIRTLAVGTLLGPTKEREINWYLHDGNPEKLLSQLTSPLLDKISQIIIHYSTSVSKSLAHMNILSLCVILIYLISEMLLLDIGGYTRPASGFHNSYCVH